MKKLFAVLMTVLLLMAMAAGCASNAGENGETGGNVAGIGTTGAAGNGETSQSGTDLTEELAAALEKLGISLEEFYGMSDEQQQTLMAELEVMMGAGGGEDQTDPAHRTYTTADVAAGGKFMVRIGDGRLNNYYLYYEDGKLVKVEVSFRKSSEEEPETHLWEGDTLPEFWYYGMTLDELIDFFDEKDYGYSTSIEAMNG